MCKVVLSLFLPLFLVASEVRAEHHCKSIAVSFSENWVPISYYKEDGTADGIAIRLHRRVLGELGVQPNFIGDIPWPRQLAMLKSGNLDALTSVNYTEERDREFLLTDSFHQFKVRAFGRKEHDVTLERVEDLTKYNVAYSRGASFGAKFDKLAEDTSNIFPINGTDNILKLLALGRVDLVILPEFLGTRLIKETELVGQISIKGPVIYEQRIHMAFSRKSECACLRDAYNKTLDELSSNGFVEDNAAIN